MKKPHTIKVSKEFKIFLDEQTKKTETYEDCILRLFKNKEQSVFPKLENGKK